MKQQLEQLNRYLQQLQLNEESENSDNYFWIYERTDRLSFVEYNERYDIYWHAGDYGYTSFPIEEFSFYKEGSASQHCMDNCKEEGYTCECEYDGQGLSWLIDILIAHPEQVRSLSFFSDDIGANGTRDWDFGRLAKSDVVFPNLQLFKIQCYEVGDHNQSIIGRIDTDNSKAVTELLCKMPNIVEVEIPGVPNEDFFKMKFPKLSYMKVQAIWNAHGFIKNLAKSPILNQISLDFMDVLPAEQEIADPYIAESAQKIKNKIEAIKNSENPEQTKKEIEKQLLKEAGYSDAEIAFEIDNPNREEAIQLMKQFCEDDEELKDTLAHYDSLERWDENGNAIIEDETIEEYLNDYETPEGEGVPTPFEDYLAVFESKYVKDSFHFKLREGALTQAQLFILQNANRNIQFLHIPTQSDYYVSHLIQK
jgi:hypothetical protein